MSLPYDSSPPRPPSRRGLLAYATWALGGVIAAIAALPVVGTAVSPLLGPRARRTSESPPIPVLAVSELEVGVPRRVEVTSSVVDAWARQDGIVLGAVWLLKQRSGDVMAFSTVCPHLGCGIDFDARGHFTCPCHTSRFDLDGARVSGPSPRGMDRLEAEVRDGWVRVRYVRFKQGVPMAEEV